MTNQAWNKLIEKVEPNRPGVGKIVMVTVGKHKGKKGIVKWHGLNKFDPNINMFDSEQLNIISATGIAYCRILIQTNEEKFFVNAKNVKILSDPQN